MCWVCNPYCGACKPPKEKPVECPGCEHYNIVDRIKDNKCGKCGAELPERKKPVPEQCLFTGLVCARPCGKAKRASKDGVLRSCTYYTSVTEEGSCMDPG